MYQLAEENGRYPEKDLAFLEARNVSGFSVLGKPRLDLWGDLLTKLAASKSEGLVPEAVGLDAWMLVTRAEQRNGQCTRGGSKAGCGGLGLGGLPPAGGVASRSR